MYLDEIRQRFALHVVQLRGQYNARPGAQFTVFFVDQALEQQPFEEHVRLRYGQQVRRGVQFGDLAHFPFDTETEPPSYSRRRRRPAAAVYLRSLLNVSSMCGNLSWNLSFSSFFRSSGRT